MNPHPYRFKKKDFSVINYLLPDLAKILFTLSLSKLSN